MELVMLMKIDGAKLSACEDGLFFECEAGTILILWSQIAAAQQMLAPDVCPECGGWGSVAREMNLKIGCGACGANAGKA